MLEGVPKTVAADANETVLAYLRDLSAHGDVADALLEALRPLGDVQTFSPDPRQYRYVAAATEGIVFAFAVGQALVGFRLDTELHRRALISGAESCPAAGPGWVTLTLFRGG